MVSTIYFIQANLQHSIAASRIKGIDMALLQEPWYRGGCTRGLNIPGYTLFFANGIDRPRACNLTRNETAWMLPGFTYKDLVAALIKYNEEGADRRMVVCSAYLPYDSEDTTPAKVLEDLVHFCEKENLYLILGYDPNAHHSVWGSTNYNSRGKILVEFLNTTDSEILNQGNEPTSCSGGRTEMIDITLGSMRLLESIIGWEVSSDHRHILFILRGSVPVRQIRIPRGTNWGSFRENLRDRLGRSPGMDMKSEAGMGLAIGWVHQALVSAYEDNCPLKPIIRGRQTLEWTKELESLRREVRRLFNKCRSDRNPHSWELYREAQRTYRKGVRKASKGALRAFCSSIDDLPSSARLHRALSRNPKIKLGSLVAPSGRRTQSEGGNLGALAYHTFPQFWGQTGFNSPCGCPPGKVSRLEAGYEGGHLQKGRMGHRLFAPYKSGWHFPGSVATGSRECNSTPGQNFSYLPGDWLRLGHMATGKGNVYT